MDRRLSDWNSSEPASPNSAAESSPISPSMPNQASNSQQLSESILKRRPEDVISDATASSLKAFIQDKPDNPKQDKINYSSLNDPEGFVHLSEQNSDYHPMILSPNKVESIPYHVYSDGLIPLDSQDTIEDSVPENLADIEIVEETVYPSPQSRPLELPFDHTTLAPMNLEVLAEGGYEWYINDWKNACSLHKLYSPTFVVGSLRWRILLFPRGDTGQLDYCSLFLDCVEMKSQKSPICAQFSLGVYNIRDPTIHFSKEAKHRFVSKATDWGFSRYAFIVPNTENTYGRPTENLNNYMENNRFLIRAQVRIVKDTTGSLWINPDLYDSRQELGYVGIKNQGATCYMNSLLQSLFFFTPFKKMLFGVPTDPQDTARNIPLALQKFFYNLHESPIAISTKELTSSFGWDSYESFIQQDIQELKALLFDSLEAKLKGTPHEKDLDQLFQIQSMRFIKCLNVDYESKSMSTFYDVPLEIKGLPNVEASFAKYIEKETFEGNNQYKSEVYGYQDAVTGNVFTRFPPVLYLNLKRYDYNFMEDRICKVNDYYEFPEMIDLSPYYYPEDNDSLPPEDQKFQLFGVLVHSGDFGGGHYYAFLKDYKQDRWIRFDDDKVYSVTSEEAIQDNFGDISTVSSSSPSYQRIMAMNDPSRKPTLTGLAARIRKLTSAYMLIYIREKDIPWVLAPFSVAKDVPSPLMTLCENERLVAEQKKQAKLRQLTSQIVLLATDDYIKDSEGPGLIESYFLSNQERLQKAKIRKQLGLPELVLALPKLEMQKQDTIEEIKMKLEQEHGIAKEHQRYWLVNRKEGSVMTAVFPLISSKFEKKTPLKTFADYNGEIVLYLEISQNLQPYTDNSILIFVKTFDTRTRSLQYHGSLLLDAKQALLSEKTNLDALQTLVPFVDFASSVLYVETGMDDCFRLNENALFRMSLEQAKFTCGDIIVIDIAKNAESITAFDDNQKINGASGNIITASDYYTWMSEKVIVTFKLNQTSDYNEAIQDVIAKRLALRTNTMTLSPKECKLAEKMSTQTNIDSENCLDNISGKERPLSGADTEFESDEEEDTTFQLELLRSMTYEQVCQALYDALIEKYKRENIIESPLHLAFRMYEPINSTCHNTFIPYQPSLTLADMLPKTHSMGISTIIYYEILPISLSLFELKKSIRIQYLAKYSHQFGSKVLLLDDGDSLSLLLEKLTLKMHVSKLQEEIMTVKEGSGRFRLIDIHPNHHTIQHVYQLPVDSLTSVFQPTLFYDKPVYHVEEIPQDQWQVIIGESREGVLVRCFSFFKDVHRTHGFPFLFHLNANESYDSTKARLKQRMQEALPSSNFSFSDKEWDRVQCYAVSALNAPIPLKDTLPFHVLNWNIKTDSLALDYPNKLSSSVASEKGLKIN